MPRIKERKPRSRTVKPQPTLSPRDSLMRKHRLLVDLELLGFRGEGISAEEDYLHCRGFLSPLVETTDPAAASSIPWVVGPRLCLRGRDLLPIFDGLPWIPPKLPRRGRIIWPGNHFTSFCLRQSITGFMETGGWLILARCDPSEESGIEEEPLRVLFNDKIVRLICPMPTCSAVVEALFSPKVNSYFVCADCLPAAELQEGFPVPSLVTVSASSENAAETRLQGEVPAGLREGTPPSSGQRRSGIAAPPEVSRFQPGGAS